MVAHPSKCGIIESIAIMIVGVLSLLLNYAVDRQKEVFKATKSGKCHIWGRPAKTLVRMSSDWINNFEAHTLLHLHFNALSFLQAVAYTDAQGKVKKSNLLLSGWWGVARHMNYTFELIHAFSWSLPAIHYGLLPFSYFFFLVGLLVHRTYRDDDKCVKKYGKGWEEYCQKVPYKLIPYVY